MSGRNCAANTCGTGDAPAATIASIVVKAESAKSAGNPCGSTAVPTTVSSRSGVGVSASARSDPASDSVTVSPMPTSSRSISRAPSATSAGVRGARPSRIVAVSSSPIASTSVDCPFMVALPTRIGTSEAKRSSFWSTSIDASGISKLTLPIATSKGQPWR